MLLENLLLILSLLVAVSMLSMMSDKLRIPYPIFLVISGLLISLVPGMPGIKLQPDLVFLIFLPPLLFAAAWNTSWKEFWKWKRPIAMLSFGLVIFTSVAVALVSKELIPGFTLAMGFLLGGIISPPDAVAATSVLQDMKVPKRIQTVLEGESLINDASSLIVFRFALVAINTGQFVLWKAGLDFIVVVLMGIIIGVAIAHIIYVILRFLPTTPHIDTVITLIAPYLMYITAEHFHFSGVLAVVSGGLFLSFRSHEIFSYNTRLETESFWGTLVFLLNGVVFIMIGLQLPAIVAGLGNFSLSEAILYAVVISLVTIAIRIIWMFPGAYVPRMLSRKIRERETRPTWQTVFIAGWSGMRGVVSLAAALSVPLALDNGSTFPHRNLILFITFVVILFTLVLQGLTLPFLIRWLKVTEEGNEGTQEQSIRLRLATAVLDHMQSAYSAESTSIEAFSRLKERYERMVEYAAQKLDQENTSAHPDFLPKYRKMLIELVEIRRKELTKMRNEKEFSDELLRKKEAELDLEEARLRK